MITWDRTTKRLMPAAAKGFEKHGRATRKAEFLLRMECLAVGALIESHYPKAGTGRPPVGLARMLRMYVIANWINLSDKGREDALYVYDGAVFLEFCRFEPGMPDSTTLLNFRHPLEEHNLGAALFAKVGELLLANGTKFSGGTIVDATLIGASPLTKDQDKSRDPEMQQTKKGSEWYSGMKLHIGTDSRTGLVHSARVTAANVHDNHRVLSLRHGDETRFYGDSACRGKEQRKRLKIIASKAMDFTNKCAYRDGLLTEADNDTIRRKFSVRSMAEHPFRTIKDL